MNRVLKQLEEDGRAFVLRPAEHVHLTNNEADADRLREYYRHGYERAQEKEQELREFLVV